MEHHRLRFVCFTSSTIGMYTQARPSQKRYKENENIFDCRIELKDFLSDSAPHVYSLRGQTNRVFKCRQLKCGDRREWLLKVHLNFFFELLSQPLLCWVGIVSNCNLSMELRMNRKMNFPCKCNFISISGDWREEKSAKPIPEMEEKEEEGFQHCGDGALPPRDGRAGGGEEQEEVAAQSLNMSGFTLNALLKPLWFYSELCDYQHFVHTHSSIFQISSYYILQIAFKYGSIHNHCRRVRSDRWWCTIAIYRRHKRCCIKMTLICLVISK